MVCALPGGTGERGRNEDRATAPSGASLPTTTTDSIGRHRAAPGQKYTYILTDLIRVSPIGGQQEVWTA